MSQHFLRYIRQEDWFSFLKCLGCRAGQGDFGADFDRGCVHFSIEVKKMQGVSSAAEDIDIDAMKATTAGQNVAQAVQDSLYRGLLNHRAGDIEQGAIPAIGRRQSFIVFRHAHQTSIVRTDLPYQLNVGSNSAVSPWRRQLLRGRTALPAYARIELRGAR